LQVIFPVGAPVFFIKKVTEANFVLTKAAKDCPQPTLYPVNKLSVYATPPPVAIVLAILN
jgi:hypothetical protein